MSRDPWVAGACANDECRNPGLVLLGTIVELLSRTDGAVKQRVTGHWGRCPKCGTFSAVTRGISRRMSFLPAAPAAASPALEPDDELTEAPAPDDARMGLLWGGLRERR